MKNKLNIVAAILSITFFISCGEKKAKLETTEKESTTEEKPIKIGCDNVHWSHHSGEDGPTNWKNLCDGFSDCGETSQSPINIVTDSIVESKELAGMEFNYGTSKVNIINNSHTVQFNVDGENTVDLNGKAYQLLQFHYHMTSEHKIDGKSYPIEVHFVHQHSDTDFAVLGIMIQEGKENELFTKHLNEFPKDKGTFESDSTIDLLSQFPTNKSYYNYSGSLTTPPCSEVVNWYILKNPVEASKEQIETLSNILINNFRPVQPLNDRKVKLYSK